MVVTRSMTKLSIPSEDVKMLKLKMGKWVEYSQVSIDIIAPSNASNYVAIRQEKTFKDLSKHILSADLQPQFHRHCDRSIIWRVPKNVVNGGTKIEESMILIKFKSSELAQEFQTKFEAYQV